MNTCPFIAHLLGDEQSEILTIEHTASDTRSSKRAKAAGGDDHPAARHLQCLKESCRFYHEEKNTCAFDVLFAELKSMKDTLSTPAAQDNAIAPRVMRELNKFWKFQTKSVTELISHMSDLDRQQRKDLESIQGELKQHLAAVLESHAEPAEHSDTGMLQELGDRIDQLREQHLGRDERLDELAAGQTDVLQGFGDRIDQLQEHQRGLEERLERIAAAQDELLGFFKADKNRREVEWHRSNKKEARTLNNLGVTSFHNGVFQTAKEQFEKAIERDPEFAEVYNNLGLVLTELGEEDKASNAFKKAAEINPDMTAAYTNLGYLLHKQGSYEEAIEIYNEALGRSSKSSSAYTNLGNAYFKLGKSAEAEEAWEKALEIDPSNEKATLYLKQIRAEKL